MVHTMVLYQAGVVRPQAVKRHTYLFPPGIKKGPRPGDPLLVAQRIA